MRIYLDTCCYSRIFDINSTGELPAEAKPILKIQKRIIKKDIELVTSFMLHYENYQVKEDKQRDKIDFFVKNFRTVYIGIDKIDELTKIVNKIVKSGIKYKDAYHIASSILSDCDYFVTFDKKILKYNSNEVKIINPVDFVEIMEGDKNE